MNFKELPYLSVSSTLSVDSWTSQCDLSLNFKKKMATRVSTGVHYRLIPVESLDTRLSAVFAV